MKHQPQITVGDVRLSFGKHRGSAIREVAAIDRQYLEWCFDSHIGGSQYEAIAAFLGEIPTPPDMKRKPANKNKPHGQKRPSASKPLHQGSFDCSDRFEPELDCPHLQPWDGITAPWLDQGGTLDNEFGQMFL